LAPAAHAQADPGSLERTIPKVESKRAIEALPVVTPAVTTKSARISGRFVVSAGNIEGATVLTSDQFSPTIEPFNASEVGQPELEKIAAAITDRYRRAGYLLSYAIIPEQSVVSGIVRMRVIEGYIDAVRVDGSASSAAAIRQIAERMSRERPLRAQTLERALGLARDVPGVVLGEARIARSPDDPARHQLVLAVGQNRFRGVVYSDNRGTIEGARMRGYAALNASSVVVPGDDLQLDLFAIPSDKFRYTYGQAKASMPLGSDGMRFIAAASKGEQRQSSSGVIQKGSSRQLNAELTYPFRKSRALSVLGRLSFSDWNSDERRVRTLIQRDRLDVLRAGIDITKASSSRIDARLIVSRGLGDAVRSGDPLASRPFGRSRFTKINAEAQILAPLGAGMQVRVDGLAQLSSAPLLAPEEFALGGSRIGRAYDFNAVTGDRGFGGMVELSHRAGDWGAQVKSIEVFAYGDAGAAYRRRGTPAFPTHQWLASSGLGVRGSVLGFFWSAELGVPLHRFRDQRRARAFFSLARAL
jgi:hemolysin activation/secretion protein